MANHKSAKKCIRQTVRRTEVNRNRISRVRTFVKKAETDVGMHSAAAVTQENAMISVVAAERELMRAARKGVVHKKAAARKISRLVKRAKAISA
ncbi:MAG: 30S ribosomal protein S20 [Holosporales bacterium]